MDQKLLFLINREWTSPALDRFFTLLSAFDVWVPFLGLLIIGVLRYAGFRGRAFILTAACIVGINDGLISNPIKKLVDRPRPFQSHNDVRMVELAKVKPRFLAAAKPLKIKLSRTDLGDVDGRSFPSSHTMNTTALALVCMAFYRRRGWLAFVPALLVAYSRIYTGSHWPSDVLISIFMALGSTLLLLALAGWLWKRFAPRCCPALLERHPGLFQNPPR